MKNKLYLVSSIDSQLEQINDIRDIPTNIPFIYREEGSATRIAMENYIRRNDIYVKKKLVLTSNEAVKQAVLAKLGISIMPLIGIRNELLVDQLQLVPIKDLPITTEWNIVWTKGKRMYPAAKAFIEFLKNEKEGIIAEYFSWNELR